MALFKKEPTALEFRAYLQEQHDEADINRQRANMSNDGVMANRCSHTAQWLAAAMAEVDSFLSMRADAPGNAD